MAKATKALVIGVSAKAGLGAALCRKFAAEGQHVLAAGRTQQRLDAVVAEIAKAGGKATALVVDATNEADVITAFDRAFADDESAPANLIVYNSGNNARGDLAKMSVEFFQQVWRITCLGGFLVAREATRRLRPLGRGTVLFTGATAALRSKPPFILHLRAVKPHFARLHSRPPATWDHVESMSRM